MLVRSKRLLMLKLKQVEMFKARASANTSVPIVRCPHRPSPVRSLPPCALSTQCLSPRCPLHQFTVDATLTLHISDTLSRVRCAARRDLLRSAQGGLSLLVYAFQCYFNQYGDLGMVKMNPNRRPDSRVRQVLLAHTGHVDTVRTPAGRCLRMASTATTPAGGSGLASTDDAAVMSRFRELVPQLGKSKPSQSPAAGAPERPWRIRDS